MQNCRRTWGCCIGIDTTHQCITYCYIAGGSIDRRANWGSELVVVFGTGPTIISAQLLYMMVFGGGRRGDNTLGTNGTIMCTYSNVCVVERGQW